ncbi:PLP-dependent aminotransferase family protein [Luteolibacter algae]|uniref:PLP-dependent aminotransferase family protein n=1 Tax=Luteolibacter algae TaxID=454151 RepID=A0ABW5D9V6_9BACT
MIAKPTLYQELSNRLAELIRSGTFSAGDRFPSVRRTSVEHRVSITTVMEAYRRLEDEGLIEARPRSGYYVKPPVLSESSFPQTPKSIRRPIEISSSSILDTVMSAVADPNVVPFGAAVPGSDIIPTAKLASISNSVIRRYGAESFSQTFPPGRRELRVALSRRLLSAGLKASPDEIITTQGATEAVLLSLLATCKAGDLVAIETPTFFGLLSIVQSLGLKVIELPVDPRDGVVIEALKLALSSHKIKACLLQPNYQNPIGSVMNIDAKKRLAALAEEHNFTIIEDDLYGDLAHDGHRPPSLACFGKNVIHCGAISKTITPGLRVGWMVPGKYYDAIHELKTIRCPSSSTTSELIIAEFLEAGGYDSHLRRVRRLYATQCAKMRQAVIEHFPDTCRVNQPAGGFVLWVEMEPAFNSERFAALAFEQGISLVPGSLFSPSCGLKNCFRLSCGFAFDERTMKAISTLGELAKQVSSEE